MTERHNNKIFWGIFIRRHVEFLGGATYLLVTMMNPPRGGTKMQQPYTKVIRDTWHETAWESCWYQAYCVFSKLTLTDIMDYGYSLFTDTWIRRISDITFQIKVNTHFAFSGLDTVHRAECYIEWWLNLYVSSFVHPLIQYPYTSHQSIFLLFNHEKLFCKWIPSFALYHLSFRFDVGHHIDINCHSFWAVDSFLYQHALSTSIEIDCNYL